MVDLIVQRHGGDKPGDAIVDPLMATDAVALARGRNEMDARATEKQPVTYDMLPVPGLAPGQLLELHDVDAGQSFRAKVVAIAMSKELSKGRVRVTVERVSDFQ